MEPAGEGCIDQCGYTHLPARRFICPKCPEPTIHERPTGERWVSNFTQGKE